jgi:alkaline phosphatase
LAVIDGVTGRVKVRLVPAGVSLPQAGYPVRAVLPSVLAMRRQNKGLEGLAVSPDGKTAWMVLQTPLGDETTYGKSRANRVIRLDGLDDPMSATVGGHFLVLHTDASVYANTKQPKVYYNSATWLGDTKLLLLERGDQRLKLFVADFAQATNLVGQPALGESSLTPEVPKPAGYQTLGITPAATTEVFDSDDVPGFIKQPPGGAVIPDKLEGVAVINPTTVAITNDNDFAVTNANDRTRIWILRLKAPLP